MHYVYLLKSKKDGKWYTGATDDLRKRISLHNKKYVPSTRKRAPFELIYYEACQNEQDSYRREKYLLEKEKLEVLIIPNKFKFSALLKFKIFRPYLRFMNELQGRLEYKKERPREDGTSRGDLSRW